MILTVGITLIIAKHKLTPAAVTPMPSLHLVQNSPSKSTIDPSKTITRPTYDAKGNPPTAPGLLMKARVFAPEPTKIVYITIDDGPYLQNTPHLLEILKKEHEATFFDVGKQIEKSTFFIITNSVGPGMMNWDQLNDLTREGNSIGSHTVHHLDLATLSGNQQENELAISKQELENHLGIRETTLCFPSGKYNKTTLALMPKLGYKLGFTTKPGKVHLGDDLLTLKRERIYGGMPIASFQSLFP